MMRKIWTVVAAGLFGMSPLALPAETLTDALISAYRNSNLLEKNQAVLRAAAAVAAVAMANGAVVVVQRIGSRFSAFGDALAGLASGGDKQRQKQAGEDAQGRKAVESRGDGSHGLKGAPGFG